MKEQEYQLLIIGGDHYNTYGVVRSLGEAGLKSDVVVLGCNKRGSFVLRSRYINNGYGCVTHDEALKVLLKYEGTDNIVICCSDEAEGMILSHFDTLSKHFILPVCQSPQETSRLMDKNSIGALAEQFGITIPKSWLVINKRVPDGITYPCITKPLTSVGGHKSDIVVCCTQEELYDVVENSTHCSNYVVQQYIEYEKEVSVLGAVLADGSVAFSGCIDKLRTCMIGTSSFAVMGDNDLLGDNVGKLETMMRSTGYRGLFSAEFLLKDGVFYFLEVNFRNDGNTYVATASGNNLPYRYVASYLKNLPRISCKATYPCYFMLDIEDFLSRSRNGVSFRRWIRDKEMVNCFLVFNKQDIKPFVKKIKNTTASIFRRSIHKVGL